MSLSLCSMRDSRAFSKSINPVENIIRASFRAIYCLGVGSNVSGLAPEGTSTSTRKSSPVMFSTIYLSGRIVTAISARASSLRVSPHDCTVSARISATIVVSICFISCFPFGRRIVALRCANIIIFGIARSNISAFLRRSAGSAAAAARAVWARRDSFAPR